MIDISTACYQVTDDDPLACDDCQMKWRVAFVVSGVNERRLRVQQQFATLAWWVLGAIMQGCFARSIPIPHAGQLQYQSPDQQLIIINANLSITRYKQSTNLALEKDFNLMHIRLLARVHQLRNTFVSSSGTGRRSRHFLLCAHHLRVLTVRLLLAEWKINQLISRFKSKGKGRSPAAAGNCGWPCPSAVWTVWLVGATIISLP